MRCRSLTSPCITGSSMCYSEESYEPFALGTATYMRVMDPFALETSTYMNIMDKLKEQQGK